MGRGKPGVGDKHDDSLLSAILAAAPLGLAVTSPTGATVFDNGGGALKTDVAATGLDLVRHDVEHDGQRYTLTLAFDGADRRAREDALFERAYFDELTQLPNRRLMATLIDRLIADKVDAFALAFIDVDDFKTVNDYYGHAIGDALLVAMTRRIASSLGPRDLFARLGGDEFLLAIVGPTAGRCPETGKTLEERLLAVQDMMRRPFHIDGYEVFTGVSIGVSRFPEDGRRQDDLVRNADRAMYLGKGDTKGDVRFYSSEIESAALQASRLEQRLRLAIRDRRICCAYQPKVDFRADQVVGLEVLMRWRDEDGLIQPPGGMVELAVELGLMDGLTRHIVAETIEALDLIDAHFGPDVTISINVAAKQATNVGFMRSLLADLKTTGRAERFMIELTEEALLARDHFQEQILPMIRAIGAKISIDDFGVGYSSLSTLADITADEIKVDRSFITDIHARPRSQSLLRTIESLGQALGMSVIVEGVETFEELAYLQAASRIRVAQGFYFARPILLETLPVLTTGPRDGRPASVTRAPAPTRARQVGGRD
jgi:diguanylate cyclase (GGDEF)-like protein